MIFTGTPQAASSRRSRTDRAATLSVHTITLAVIGLGLLTGTYTALTWHPVTNDYDLIFIRVQFVVFIVGMLLALPGLIAALRHLLRGQVTLAARYALGFAGTVAVFLGTELWSHEFLPCGQLEWLCTDGSIASRWHQLHHATVMGVPLLLLWRYAMYRWHPAMQRE